MDIHKLKDICAEVRNYLEAVKVPRKDKKDLECYCAHASALIIKRFNNKELKWLKCPYHIYLEYKGYYICITGRQFSKDMPKIYFKKKIPHLFYYMDVEETGSTVRGLRKALLADGWPIEQIPSKTGELTKKTLTKGPFFL